MPNVGLAGFSPEPLRELSEWMESYRQFWTDSFDRLDEHLKGVQAKKKGKKDGK